MSFNLAYFRNRIDEVDGIPTLQTWDYLRQIKIKYDLQTPEVKKEYQNFLNGLKLDFKTPEGYLIDKYKLKDKETILLPNQFPYDLAKGIKHTVFWINSNDQGYIKKALEIQKEDFLALDHICFKIEPQNQSVGKLTHFHFLYKI
jgi:signal peptidase I